MPRRSPFLRHAAPTLLCILFLSLLLTRSEAAMDGVRQGMSLCVQTLFPSLFPFLVLSELLVCIGGGEIIGKLLGKPVKGLFGLSDAGASALLMGSVCGFPVGTTTAVSLYDNGRISHGELCRLVLFCNNPSSGFLISAVGGALVGNTGVGVALFVITLLSAALVGIFLRILCGSVSKKSNFAENGVRKPICVSQLTESVRRAFFALLSVCAFVLFFSCAAHCLSQILTGFALPPAVEGALCGMLEMTSGISRAVRTLPPSIAFRLVAFFSAFAGLCVCLQIFSVLEGKGVPLAPYLLAKLMQGGLALLLAEIYLCLWRPSLSPTSSVQTFALRNTPGTLLLMLVLFAVLWVLERRLIKRKRPPLGRS